MSTKPDKYTEDQTRRMTEANGFKHDPKKAPAVPRPSASVLLISPTNQVLLLQRVKTTTSFASAHVFPGGNLSSYHDNTTSLPPPSSPAYHLDSPEYRLAAIRETFEESGILLARNNGFGRLIELSDEELLDGRKKVHGNRVPFTQWLAAKGGRADVDGLIPFTRWVTPTNVPKRFTTQMYLYFLPTERDGVVEEGVERGIGEGEGGEETRIPVPTTDGGLEHTNARFLPAAAWCRLAQEGRIILFPPQFFLLHWVAGFLDGLRSPHEYGSLGREKVGREEMERRRKALVKFVKGTEGEGDEVSWMDKCVSPMVMPLSGGKKREDGRGVLALHNSGHELKGTGRTGVKNWCVLVDFQKEGPRRLGVISRAEALGQGAKL